jgi:putative transposase
MVRLQVGRNPQPSILIIGSQSVKASFGESRGYDGFKKVRGRKRHILVDTLGIVFAVRVSPANVGDVDEGLTLLRSAKSKIEQRGLRAI